MAIAHASHDRRRWFMLAFAVLAGAAIVLPLGIRGLDHDGARASAASPEAGQTPGVTSGQPQGGGSSAGSVGPRGELPPLLSSAANGVRSGLSAGMRVRLGDVTTGTLRRTPGAGWQVVVLWAGRHQALPTRGPVSLGGTSWVAASGHVYTRVPLGPAGEFRVYSWDPRGGSAYTPPTLAAVSLGRVCFTPTFTDFGTC